MKTRNEIIEEVKNKIPAYAYPENGTLLGNDLQLLALYAATKDYLFGTADAYALGYMAGESQLTSLFDDETALREAINKYDNGDATNRFDTVAETLIDLLDFKL